MASISKELRQNVTKGCEGKAFYLEVDAESGKTIREICLIAHVLTHGSGPLSDCKVEGSRYHDSGARKPNCPGLSTLRVIHPGVLETHQNSIPKQSENIHRRAIPFNELQEE